MKMKATFFVTLLSVLFIACGNFNFGEQVNGEGAVSTKERTVKDFDAIDVSNGIIVNLTQGDAISVEVTADENLHELIKTEVQGNTLRIYSEKNIGKAESKLVNVTAKDLTALGSSSGSKITVNGKVKAKDFDIDISSGSGVTIDLTAKKVTCEVSSGSWVNLQGSFVALDGDASSGSNIKAEGINMKTCKLDASSGSNIIVSGGAEALTAEASSGSTVKAADLEVKKCTASASSSGNIKINVTEELSAEAGSGSNIYYKGEPRITHSDISNSGKLKKM